jgi:hypothetical protein
MKIVVNKTNFVSCLLNPTSKLTDNICLDFNRSSDEVKIKTLASSPDGNVIFMGSIDCEVDVPSKCIIPDCKTFLRLFSEINEEKITLTVDTNSIKYKGGGLSFGYYLLDEGYFAEKKSLSETKLNELQYDTNFEITKNKFSEILKYNSIIPDAEKLYFYTDGTSVNVKLGDEQKSNTNEIVTEISKSFSGAAIEEPLPLNIQYLHLMTFAVDSIKVSVNKGLKIVKFSTPNFRYIVSGLVK